MSLRRGGDKHLAHGTHESLVGYREETLAKEVDGSPVMKGKGLKGGKASKKRCGTAPWGDQCDHRAPRPVLSGIQAQIHEIKFEPTIVQPGAAKNQGFIELSFSIRKVALTQMTRGGGRP